MECGANSPEMGSEIGVLSAGRRDVGPYAGSREDRRATESRPCSKIVCIVLILLELRAEKRT